ncbi:hypothetical protein QBC47DRAFT_417524 [Echria macrotheca]|uniref:Uncharacterized protein n=1 Tax=Echria macrotheca TaxID=438768 RepID=A0AAJ0B3N4_9PEZI|nr:hypothetical protein QBC47DRAFT_417524 [Echria macrotheca]
MLIKIDGMALDDWVFRIQPNSVISVCMTISKSALLFSISECISQSKWLQFRRAPRPLSMLDRFDEASRGPWGSTRLVFCPRAAGLVAWLGALLTVICFATDPFSQQILAFPSRNVASPTAVAEIAVSQSLKRISSAAVHGAVLGSLYTPRDHYITYNCTTSTCEWDVPVTSLGVCSSCRNLSSLIAPNCTTTPGPLFPNNSAEPGQAWSFSTTACIYTVKPDISLAAYIQTLSLPGANGRHAEYASQYTRNKIASTNLALGSTINPKITYWVSTVLSFTTRYDNGRDLTQEGIALPPLDLAVLQPELTACGMYYCAQIFDPSMRVTNGTLVHASHFPASYPLSPALPGDASQLMWPPGDNNDINETTLPTTSDRPPPPMFTVSQQAQHMLEGALRSIFSVTKTAGNDDFGGSFPDPDSGLDGLSTPAYRNVSAAWASIAASLSGQIRTAGGSQVAVGRAMVDETFVRVSWGWMALPLGLVVCVGLLLGITVHRNWTERIWKGSSVALVAHQLTGCEREMEEEGLGCLEMMGKFAKGVNVSLEADTGLDGASRQRYNFVRALS